MTFNIEMIEKFYDSLASRLSLIRPERILDLTPALVDQFSIEPMLMIYPLWLTCTQMMTSMMP